MLRILFFLQLLFLCMGAYASTRVLSLQEAIFLAIRENPNIQQAQLNLTLQKYALDLAHWQFKPHYSFSAFQTTSQNFSVNQAGYVSQNTTGVKGEATLQTPIGTQLTLTPMLNRIGEKTLPSLSLEVSQPLLRGFGKPIVEAALYNAIDDELISRLRVQDAVQSTVTLVINAYLDVLSAEKNLEVAEDAFNRAKLSFKQTQIFIKAGHKAGMELVTVDADVANARARIEIAKNNLAQSRYALLETIGVNPNMEVTFKNIDIAALIKKYHVPALKEAKILSLRQDIQYQIDKITIQGATKRQLMLAEDQTRWDLNLTANAVIERADEEDEHEFDHFINGVNQTNSLTLNLNIPIDDKNAKNAVIAARIALKQANIALQQEQWNKETETITGWNNIYSEARSLRFAEHAEKLQEETWDISFKKYTHGLIDSLQLQTAQQQLINSQQELNLARINYLKSLVNFDQKIGRTLKTWHIEVQYGSK